MSDEHEAFKAWYFASKYCQVVIPAKHWEQIAWDGWQAAANCRKIVEKPAQPVDSTGTR
jgi:hypothetical protein